jgi:polyhydroxyalkanoate synthase
MARARSKRAADEAIRLVPHPVTTGDEIQRADRPPQSQPPVRAAADQESYAAAAWSEIVDRSVHVAMARFTLGASPAAMAESYLDWATHLATSPGKQMRLAQKAAQKFQRLAGAAGCAAP